jgi:arginase
MIDLLVVPYDSARRAVRMGSGPLALLSAGLIERLERQGFTTAVSQLEPTGVFHTEIATAFDLHRIVRGEVTNSVERGHLAIVLAGNCNTGVVGCLAAHDADDVGLFWFDAHSDAETPETSTSGFFDGMGFAVVLNECWRPKLEELGWSGLSGTRAALVGAREISPAAQSLLDRHGVAIVPPQKARPEAAEEALADAISKIRSAGASRVHVHVDLDVLDSDLVGPANGYALPMGLTVELLLAHLRLILEEFPVVSASLASYDPAYDNSGNISAAALEIITLLASNRRNR